jgi:hypothetical protein
MRVFAGIAATAILFAACSTPAAVSTPTPTASPTAPPTASPTPVPTVANVFKADLKSSNEVAPNTVTDAEASCAGTATVTFTSTTAKFDVAITGCPASTVINIGHIHEGAAGVAGGVKISTGLAAGDLTLTGGGVTFSRTATADAALISAIIANPAGYYVNFHSAAHPVGVIRGQLTKA